MTSDQFTLALEQLALELLNAARSDPGAEVARLGIGLNDGLAPGSITAEPKQPLAYNLVLHDAAVGHADWMLAADVFSHTGAGGSSSNERMVAAGYGLEGNWVTGENLAWFGSTQSMTDAREERYVRDMHDNLVLSEGHRENIMAPRYREVGIAEADGVFTSRGTDYNAAMLVYNFGRSGSESFLTGVVYDDLDGDGFYSIGEGRSGISVSIAGVASAVSAAAGGYGLAKGSGQATVTFSGGGLSGARTVALDLSGDNAKLDLVDGDTVRTSRGLTIVEGIGTVEHVGAYGGSSTGNDAANRFLGGAGADVFVGLAGNDTLDGGAGDDTLTGGEGDDRLIGGAGTDSARFAGSSDSFIFGMDGDSLTVVGEGRDVVAADVERLVFSDRTLTFAEAASLVGEDDELRIEDPSPMVPTLEGTPGDDMLVGTVASERIVGTTGNDTVDGGGGTDVLVHAGAGADWTPERLADGAVALAGPGGTDRLTNVERVDLDDGAWLLDLWDAAALSLGEAYRLYAAAVDRTPDEAGLRHWHARLESGALDLETLAGRFLESDEFEASYGADPTDEEYLDALYNNTLKRNADQEGFDYWLPRLEDGRVDRAGMLVRFSESDENRARTDPFIEDATWVTAPIELFG
ncbi:MAG: DUF4214 domain-containing protein [Pseudomonadota bacterium]